jgi:hypothetical protein
VTCNAPGAHAEQVAQGGKPALVDPPASFRPPLSLAERTLPLGRGGCGGGNGEHDERTRGRLPPGRAARDMRRRCLMARAKKRRQKTRDRRVPDYPNSAGDAAEGPVFLSDGDHGGAVGLEQRRGSNFRGGNFGTVVGARSPMITCRARMTQMRRGRRCRPAHKVVA